MVHAAETPLFVDEDLIAVFSVRRACHTHSWVTPDAHTYIHIPRPVLPHPQTASVGNSVLSSAHSRPTAFYRYYMIPSVYCLCKRDHSCLSAVGGVPFFRGKPNHAGTTCVATRLASKAAGGSSTNGRNSRGRRLGVKKFGG